MPSKLGLDASRMDGGGANPAVAMPQVERYREKDVGCLRAAVGNPWVVRSALEVGVLKIDVGVTMPADARLISRPPGRRSGAILFTRTKWPR
jgi:hypothetical protein